jgi:hypothetical protein
MAFVPEGQADSSQARSAWYRRKAAPSRRDGRSHCQSQCQQNRFNRPAINYCKSYSIIKIDYVSQEHGCRKGSS